MSESSLDRSVTEATQTERRWSRFWLLIPTLLGGCLFLIWALMTGWFAPVVAVDINQTRTNTVLPTPGPTIQLRQSFVPQHDGLSEVEVILARSAEAEGIGRLELQLLDSNNEVIAARSFETQELRHNQSLLLRFPPQAESAGQQYKLLIGGTAGNDTSVWGYDLDVYGDGEMTIVGGDTTAQDLRFVTRYQLLSSSAIKSLVDTIITNAGLLLLALAFAFMPGSLILLIAKRWVPRTDPGAWLGLALALGLASWPLIWLWSTVLGLRWRSWSLWLVLILGWASVIWLLVSPKLNIKRNLGEFDQTIGRPSLTRHAAHFSWHHLLLLLILLVGLAVRLLAIRDLVFPPWVDSIRHALITTVMSENGQTIQDYQPYLDVFRFPYHFGFHTLSASLFQMTGVPLPRLLLILGQLINALVPLATYSAVYLLVRKPGVSLLAAFLVALPFFFPGYYVTWGRMTQLTAMVVLAATVAYTWKVIRGARTWRRSWWLLALLVAGLFLIHFRLFLLYLVFAGLTWLISRGRHGRWLAFAASGTAILVGPHVIRLVSDSTITIGGRPIPGYNDFPFGYLTIGWEQAFLLLAGAIVLLAALAGFRGKAWAWLPLTLAAWGGLVTLFLSGQKLVLPEFSLLNLNSAYISAFLPLAIILAIGAGQIWRWLRRRQKPVQALGVLVAGAALAAALMLGIRQQMTILNPVTVLAWPQDMEGLAWLNENLEQSAKVAVSSWVWLGRTWAGSDGGAWIVPLTGIASTTPPADYIYSRTLAEGVEAFNTEASTNKEWSDPSAADWLRQQGVTHVYVGAKGGYFNPGLLARNPDLQLLYQHDGVFIFAVQ